MVDRHKRVSAESLSARGRVLGRPRESRRCRVQLSRLFRPQPARRLRHERRQAGVSALKTRAQAGHASDAMLSRYIRDGELFLDNAAGALL